jgi:ABC-type lipoprotein release transport system permease subunit
MFEIARLLVHLGLQSLRAHRAKTLIVGGLMVFGAFLVTVSLALLDSVERSTRATIVQSISGDMQLYSAAAKDSLSLFGGIGLGTEDLGEVESYQKVKEAIAGVDNVAGVVPVGLANAVVAAPGDLDRTLNALRNAVKAGDKVEEASLVDRLKGIIAVLAEQQKKQASVSSSTNGSNEDALAIVDKAASPQLWSDFAADPVATLDWLDTKLAPLGEQGNQFIFRLVGTDLTAFTSTFSRLKIVEGEAVPPNTRGLLVGKSFIDRRLKMAVAMNLDTISRELERGDKIAVSTTLQETVAKARRASPRIIYLLEPKAVEGVSVALAAELGKPAGTKLSEALLEEFLALTDENFARRYKLFYDVIAPHIQLYPFRVGDTITMSAFTKSGYLRSINTKVYGIYTIEGLEGNDLAGALSLTDLVTFRELYGQRTAALDDELKAMREKTGAAEVKREDAEAALFGGDDTAAVEVAVAAPTEAPATDLVDKLERKELLTFDQADVNTGMVTSVGVLLKDGSKSSDSIAAIKKIAEPLGLQVADWQQSTGLIGQITLVVRAILLGAIAILFLVTIVILNNSLVMATLERVSEFGTLRAIGAQKSFVNAMVVFETGVLAVIAGSIGAGLGVGVIALLHKVGIPAPADIFQVLFGGPRLFPSVTVFNVFAGLLATFIVAVLATLYPARLAVSVQPVVAMQGKE